VVVLGEQRQGNIVGALRWGKTDDTNKVRVAQARVVPAFFRFGKPTLRLSHIDVPLSKLESVYSRLKRHPIACRERSRR